MNESRELAAGLETLLADPQFQSETAQIEAKALLSRIADRMPGYSWSYLIHRVLRNMVFAGVELQNLVQQHPDELERQAMAARKLALIWESLAQLREGTDRVTALMNAAVNYEIAGYEANATCIARLIEQEMWDGVKDDSIGYITSLFLERRFLKLIAELRKTGSEPQVGDKLDETILQATLTGFTGKALGDAVGFFLRGDRSALLQAVEEFKRAEEAYASLSLIDESNLMHSIRTLLPVMERKSIWNVLPQYSLGDSRWERYLRLLARGVGDDIFRSRSVCELWPSQLDALNSSLLESHSNKLIRMPTSAGKTRIAEIVMIHTLLRTPMAKCIYVAPYRALSAEVEQSFFNVLNDLGFRVSSVVGGYETDQFEDMLTQNADVLVLTPEKLDLVVRALPDFISNVRLIVIDEGQIVDDPTRGVKFDLLITRIKRKVSHARIVTLSAVFSNESLEDFATWLNASSAGDIIVSDWRPSIQRRARFDWTGNTGILRYMPDENDIELIRQFVPGVIYHREFEFVNPTTGRVNHERFPDKNSKAQVAAELAFKFADLGPVLIFCTQPDFVEAVARALEHRIHLCYLCGEPVPTYFQGEIENRSSLIAREWLGTRPFANWFKRGIGVHYGRLPELIKRAVESDFRKRKLRVMVATNTLAQGVNLPVRTVIVHSCRRFQVDAEKSERLSARDYWNIAGRAGRAGEETEGLIVHINLGRNDERDFEYYIEKRMELEPVRSALYQKLLDIINERLSPEALRAEIDPEVLALLVEEGPGIVEGETLREVLGETLGGIQASREGVSLEKLYEIFGEVAQDIMDRVPEREDQVSYSVTGLSTTSCQIIREAIQDKETEVRQLLMGEETTVDKEIEFVFSCCMSLPEMQPRYDFDGSYEDLLKSWVDGTDMSAILGTFSNDAMSPEQLGRFIDDLFGYRLPWGVSAAVRIASKALGVSESDVCELMRFLPSMIKFGVPDPVACWAMSIGIPFRSVAIRIAAAYQSEYESPEFEGFLMWVGTLGSERLQYEFELTGPILEEVSKAVFLSGKNPLLEEYKGIQRLLPVETEVRGIAYEGRAAIASRVKAKQIVELERDYDNPVDRNAIAVSLNGRRMGYIPRELAQVLAPEMDTGTRLVAMVTKVIYGRIPSIYLLVEILGTPSH